MEGLLKGAAAASRDESVSNVERSVTATVVGNSLLAFSAGLSRQNRLDILDCFTLANLEANERFDFEKQSAEWLFVYMTTLSEHGWEVSGSQTIEASTQQGDFNMGQVVRELIRTALTDPRHSEPTAVIMLETTDTLIETLKADQPIRPLEHLEIHQRGANFQMGVFHETAEGRVSVVLVAVSFKTHQQIENIWLSEWRRGQASLEHVAYRLSFSHENYEGVNRQKAQERLERRAGVFRKDIEING